MKGIAGGGFLEEIKFRTHCSTNEDTAIKGEGQPLGPLDIGGIQEEFRVLGIPYLDPSSSNEGKPGEGRVKQKLTHVMGLAWDRK